MSLMCFTLTVQNSSDTGLANFIPTTAFKYFPFLKKPKQKKLNI